MALAAAAVNNFKTVTKVVQTTTDVIYEAPVGFVGVILLAQCANIGSNEETLSFFHNRTVGSSTVTTEIIKDFPIPGNDDARRSINLYCDLLKDTIKDAEKLIKGEEEKSEPNKPNKAKDK